MAVSEVRTQIYLERSQHEELKRLATLRAVSMARIVREAISSYLASPPERIVRTDQVDPAWALLEAVDEIGGSGGGESADRIEEELYGPIRS